MINLKKGEGINLSKAHPSTTKFVADLSWDPSPAATQRVEMEIVSFLLTQQGDGSRKCAAEGDFVFYNNLKDPTGSVTHNPDDWQHGDDTLLLDLAKLSQRNPDILEVSVIAEIYEGLERRQDFGHVNHATVKIIDADSNVPLAQFRLTEEDAAYTAVQLGSFVSENGEWHFKAVGKGYNKGLEAFVIAYGLQVGVPE
jgi:tellurium resistance protein TerD